MYRKKDKQQNIHDFILSFDGALAADNRWVTQATRIPWNEIEGDYSDLFPSGTGNVAKPARVPAWTYESNDILAIGWLNCF